MLNSEFDAHLLAQESPVPIVSSERSDVSNSSPHFADEIVKKDLFSGSPEADREEEPLDYIEYAYSKIVVQNKKYFGIPQ